VLSRGCATVTFCHVAARPILLRHVAARPILLCHVAARPILLRHVAARRYLLSRGCATISVAWLRDSTIRENNGPWNLFNSRPYKTTAKTRGIGAGACLYSVYNLRGKKVVLVCARNALTPSKIVDVKSGTAANQIELEWLRSGSVTDLSKNREI
jgi:hypothetical protein